MQVNLWELLGIFVLYGLGVVGTPAAIIIGIFWNKAFYALYVTAPCTIFILGAYIKALIKGAS